MKGSLNLDPRGWSAPAFQRLGAGFCPHLPTWRPFGFPVWSICGRCHKRAINQTSSGQVSMSMSKTGRLNKPFALWHFWFWGFLISRKKGSQRFGSWLVRVATYCRHGPSSECHENLSSPGIDPCACRSHPAAPCTRSAPSIWSMCALSHFPDPSISTLLAFCLIMPHLNCRSDGRRDAIFNLEMGFLAQPSYWVWWFGSQLLTLEHALACAAIFVSHRTTPDIGLVNPDVTV